MVEEDLPNIEGNVQNQVILEPFASYCLKRNHISLYNSISINFYDNFCHRQARKGFLHSHLFRDRVEMKEEENVGLRREGFLTQVKRTKGRINPYNSSQILVRWEQALRRW